MIYLDNAATSWPKPDSVVQAMEHCMRHAGANPGRGGHRMSLDAGRILFDCRDALAQLFRIEDPNQIAFMLNATDAINTALLGLLKNGDHVVTTSMEHNAVARPLRYLERRGIRLTIVPADRTGSIDAEDIKKACRADTKLIVMGHASNVTGTLMPVAEVGAFSRAQGIFLLVDAAQTAGIEEIDVNRMGIDLLAFTGHKSLLGPQGTGGLWIREHVPLEPIRWGGTGSNSESDLMPDIMPDKLESGTPNTVGLAGLAAGVKYVLAQGPAAIKAHEMKLTQQLLDGLQSISRVMIHGPKDITKQTAVVSFTVVGMDSGQVGYLLDRQYNTAMRTGLHCAPWAHNSIGTLRTGTVRASVGCFNNGQEIDATVEAIRSIVEG